MIEAVEITPLQPCKDEEVLVRVRLRPEAVNAKTAIRGKMGQQAVFVFDAAGPIDVTVLADDWVDGIDSRVVPITVVDCPARPRLVITQALIGSAHYRFVAVSSTGALLETVRWRIGDEGWVAGSNTLEHSFALRPQRTTSETVLVEAEAGPDLRGRTTVFLVNQSHLTRLFGNTFLPVVASQFPERVGEKVIAKAQLRNLFSHPTRFDAVVLRAFPCDDGEARESRWAPGRLLSQASLGAEAIEAVEVELPAEVLAGSCRVEVRLTGQAEAKPFSAMWGVSTGVPTSAEIVSDPKLLERVRRAQQALGRSTMTPKELEAFERRQP